MKTSTSNEGYIFYSADNSTGLRVSMNTDGTLSWNEQVSNGDSYLNTPGTVNDGNWHHIAMTRDSGVRKIWIDGSQNTFTNSGGRNFNNSNTFRIGRREAGAYYSGLIMGAIITYQDQCRY
jgi:hypothetical protein